MTDPSFDQIDFGPGYIYAPYPALEEVAPVEESNQVPIELRMTPPLELDEEFIRARLLQRDMVDEMFRRVAESISESLRQCAGAPEEPFVHRYLPVVQPPAGVIIGDATA